MEIKAIVFDCFGVLIAAGNKALNKQYPDKRDELLKIEKMSDLGQITRQQFLEKVSGLTGLSVEQLQEDYYFTDDSGYNLSAIDWVKQVRQTGLYKVGLLSNVGRGWLDNFLVDIDGDNLFDAEILSGDVGIVKPNPDIFRLMAKKLGVKPENCVMIDDLEENIDGARSAGMQGVVFYSTRQAKAELAKILGD